MVITASAASANSSPSTKLSAQTSRVEVAPRMRCEKWGVNGWDTWPRSERARFLPVPEMRQATASIASTLVPEMRPTAMRVRFLLARS